jgi:chorismate mutase/prephenate dehydratase
MKEHKFHIVKSIRLPIVHNLVVNNGATMDGIKEIFSHEQALNQCRKYIEKNFPNATITVYANTAMAAKMVSESGRTDIAAISSKECAELYNLKVFDGGIQDASGNYTRFILITKDFEIYKGSHRISIMTTLSHTPGSLFKLLGKFSNLGINLTKLESRPMIGLDFEFMFYFDFECDIARRDVQNLIAELDCSTEQFTFLGAYNEVI